MAGQNVPPDPGGYLETSNFGLFPPHWHSYNGKDLHGRPAVDHFNRYASNPIPGGSQDPRKKGNYGES